MKKLFAILLAVAMICALSVTAFADQIKEEIGDFTAITIEGKYTDIVYEEDAYYVTLKYTPVTFEYAGGNAAWNPTNLKWDAPTGADWVTAEADITIENRSTEGVTATFAVTNPAEGLDIQLQDQGDQELAEGKVVLASAAPAQKTGTGSLQSATVTVAVVDGTIEDDVDICTVTVSIA